MKKTKIMVVLILALLIGTGIGTAQHGEQEQLEMDNTHINPIPNRLYQCLIICGLPWVIIVTTLGYVAQGMAYAQALILAGATMTMILCVLLCIASGENNNECSTCD